VISEAIVAGTPVIASHIAGNVGLLGETYAGYFDVGDTCELAHLLERVENDVEFVELLKVQYRKQVQNFDPALEKRKWSGLIEELVHSQ
jgi:glycosyltransferase involved in cell wall biosynthesis